MRRSMLPHCSGGKKPRVEISSSPAEFKLGHTAVSLREADDAGIASALFGPNSLQNIKPESNTFAREPRPRQLRFQARRRCG